MLLCRHSLFLLFTVSFPTAALLHFPGSPCPDLSLPTLPRVADPTSSTLASKPCCHPSLQDVVSRLEKDQQLLEAVKKHEVTDLHAVKDDA